MRAAAAEIAVHPFHDRIARGVRLLLKERPGVHDHSGGAVAALKTAVIDEGLLQRMQLAVAFQSLNRDDVLAVHICERELTRPRGFAVDGDGTCPADSEPAAVLGAG